MSPILVVLDVVLAMGVTAHAVLWKRDSRAVIGWVGLAWMAPLVGACAYFFFGVNRIRRKAESLQMLKGFSARACRSAKQKKYKSQCEQATSTMQRLKGPGT